MDNQKVIFLHLLHNMLKAGVLPLLVNSTYDKKCMKSTIEKYPATETQYSVSEYRNNTPHILCSISNLHYGISDACYDISDDHYDIPDVCYGIPDSCYAIARVRNAIELFGNILLKASYGITALRNVIAGNRNSIPY